MRFNLIKLLTRNRCSYKVGGLKIHTYKMGKQTFDIFLSYNFAQKKEVRYLFIKILIRSKMFFFKRQIIYHRFSNITASDV